MASTILTIMRNPRFRLLWLAQLLVTLGNELYNVTVLVLIFQESGSALQTSLAFVVRTIPAILLSAVTGVVVDRYSRRNLLLLTNSARALVLLGFLLLPREFRNQLPALYALVIALAVADAFYQPAQLSFLPAIVRRNELVGANSILTTSNHAIFAATFVLGAWLSQFDFLRVLLIEVGVFALASLFILAINTQRIVTAITSVASHPPLLQEIRTGLNYLNGHHLARALIKMEYMEYWPHGVWSTALMLAFTVNELKGGVELYGWQSALFYGGQLLGGVLALGAAQWLTSYSGRIIIINSLVNALFTLIYASTSSMWVAMAVCFVFGPPTALRDILQDSLLQTSVDADKLGRIYSTRQALVNINYTLATLLFAWVADSVPARLVYFVGAGLYVVVSLYAISQAALRNSTLRQPLPIPDMPQPAIAITTLPQVSY